MPTVLSERGFRVMIYTHDHEPKHVHVKKTGMTAVINLEPLEIREFNRSATEAFLRSAWELVAEHRDALLQEWDKIGPLP